MEKKFKKPGVIIFVFVFSVLFSIFGVLVSGINKQVYAASKKAYYITEYREERDSEFPSYESCKLKGRKFVIKGTLDKSKSLKKLYLCKGKRLKYKTHTFILSKDCKYYSNDFEGLMRMSKKQAKSFLMSGLSITLYTNKKGEVYKLVFSV